MPVPAEAYKLYAAGEISSEELEDLEKFAEFLEKSAGAPGAARSMFNPQTAAALGGLAVAAPTLAYVGSAVPRTLQGAVNSMRFESGLQRTLEVNPHLGSPKDTNLRMAYKTLQTTNPDYAQDPLIAGTILDMVMANRMDPNNPASAPRFDPALLSEIQKTRAKDPDATSAIGAGARSALELG
jgi:hypothetical protein